MTGEMFIKFERDRLYARVAEHIEELIVTGRLQPGDQLPPEREWAQQMNVGRGVVRDSVKLLAERGLVDVTPGRGTFVAEFGGHSLAANFDRSLKIAGASGGDLAEARKVLEIAIVGLAAQKAEDADLEKLKHAIAKMDENIESPDGFIEADLSFHQCLAEATGNKLFPLLIEVMADLLREERRRIFRTAGAPERGQAWHRRIYEAVEQRDVTAARIAMERHLEQVYKDGSGGGAVASVETPDLVSAQHVPQR